MIFDRIVKDSPPNTVIPKPEAKSDFIVKGIGKRRGEEALIYFIPNHKNPNKPSQKGITRTELEKAYKELNLSGTFTKKWFDKNLIDCSSEGSCNFTTIGGLFQKIGFAKYLSPGIYIIKKELN